MANPVPQLLTQSEKRGGPLLREPIPGPDPARPIEARSTQASDRQLAGEITRIAQQEMLTRIAQAVEFRDGETGLHSRRVGLLAGSIARMSGMSEDEVVLIEQAAPLHDIGTIGIPDSILLNAGPLTQAEFEIMKTHTLIGAKLLRGGSSELMLAAEQICLWHHERWDGSGYPSGLREEETPRFVQVVWLADVVDALGHARAYRAAWPLDLIVADLKSKRGRKFGAETVDACLELLTAQGAKERWLQTDSPPRRP